MNRAHSSSTRERGSMLVEAMAALAVVALVMTMGFRTMAESAARVRAAAASEQAMLVARTRLASVGADIPLAPGEIEGRDQGLDWRVVVSPEAAPASIAGELWRASVTVSEGQTVRARLETLRVGPPA